MKRIEMTALRVRLLSVLVCTLLGSALAQEARPLNFECSTAAQALKEYSLLDSNSTRKDVEKSFTYEGGIQSPNDAFYLFKGCQYIKLEVEYEPDPQRGNAFSSPNDRVKKLSKLFVGYPRKD